MKKLQELTAVLVMFFVIIGVLITSFQFVIYGDPEYKFYEKEYKKYNVTESLDMTIEDVMEVTDYMMDYLIGRVDELSIVTNVDGSRQDFFNEQDRLHMADVRNLFLGGLKLRVVLLSMAAAGFLLLVIWMKKAGLLKRAYVMKLFFRAYSIAIGVFLGILAFLAVAFSIDFTACFTIFHKIFFTNDLWLFDPATDYMIRMLPEGFFADIVARIAVTFVGMLLLLWGILFAGKRFFRRKAGK